MFAVSAAAGAGTVVGGFGSHGPCRDSATVADGVRRWRLGCGAFLSSLAAARACCTMAAPTSPRSPVLLRSDPLLANPNPNPKFPEFPEFPNPN